MRTKLCVKLSQDLSDMDIMKEHMADIVEIHLIDAENINPALYERFDNIVFHASSQAYELEEITLDMEQQDIVEESLKSIAKVQAKCKLLLHCGWHNDRACGEDIIKYLQQIYSNYKVPILLENTIYKGAYERSFKVINQLHNLDIKACLDTAHIRAIINQGANYKEYYKNMPEVNHVHFSYSSNGDGYRDMRTHGINHPTIKEVYADMGILRELGVQDFNLCPEVEESCHFYKYRENQRIEIELLKHNGIIH